MSPRSVTALTPTGRERRGHEPLLSVLRETFAYSGIMCSVDDTRCRDPTSVGT
jgi:hypothetical protein